MYLFLLFSFKCDPNILWVEGEKKKHLNMRGKKEYLSKFVIFEIYSIKKRKKKKKNCRFYSVQAYSSNFKISWSKSKEKSISNWETPDTKTFIFNFRFKWLIEKKKRIHEHWPSLNTLLRIFLRSIIRKLNEINKFLKKTGLFWYFNLVKGKMRGGSLLLKWEGE